MVPLPSATDSGAALSTTTLPGARAQTDVALQLGAQRWSRHSPGTHSSSRCLCAHPCWPRASKSLPALRCAHSRHGAARGEKAQEAGRGARRRRAQAGSIGRRRKQAGSRERAQAQGEAPEGPRRPRRRRRRASRAATLREVPAALHGGAALGEHAEGRGQEGNRRRLRAPRRGGRHRRQGVPGRQGAPLLRRARRHGAQARRLRDARRALRRLLRRTSLCGNQNFTASRRWRGGVGSSPLDGASVATSSPSTRHTG